MTTRTNARLTRYAPLLALFALACGILAVSSLGWRLMANWIRGDLPQRVATLEAKVSALEERDRRREADIKALRSLPWRIEVRPVVERTVYQGLPGFAGKR